jgi:hypothetical protein
MIQLSNPIFLNVELTKAFVTEYPKCTQHGKILVLPYPALDYGMYRYRNHVA